MVPLTSGDIWVDRDQEKPEWVKTEQEAFRTTRDANKDGFLDRQEVRDWIFPRDYDHSESEMKHLISQSDDNQVGHSNREKSCSVTNSRDDSFQIVVPFEAPEESSNSYIYSNATLFRYWGPSIVR